MKKHPFQILLTSVSTLILLFGIAVNAYSFQQQNTYFASDASRLWFEGSSNVNEFACNAENYTGEALLPDYQESESSALLNQVKEVLSSVKLEIEVDSIECGQRKMNRDLQKALKADKFPEITFNFRKAELASQPQSHNDVFDVQVHGELTVAGETREISFITEAHLRSDERFRARGQTTIKMTDFGVEPPRALMGLIRADDELTVHFDLIATGNND